MKAFSKIFSSVFILSMVSSMALATELATANGGAKPTWVPEFEKKKTGCPVKPVVDPKLVKECPKALGDTPIENDEAQEYIVREYVPETESYLLTGVEFPDEGDFPVTLEGLAKSDAVLSGASAGDKMSTLRKALTSPCDLLKKKFKIKKLATLSNAELKARKNCVRK